jgi:lipid-A-disaccharide synthase
MMLPLMLSLRPHFPDYQFIVAGLSYHSTTFYQQQVAGYKTAIVTDRTYDLLSCADAALVTSGTATLETALHNVPQVVCYKGNPVSFWIGKQLVDVAYISLVNLILEEELVQELIQSDLTKENLQRELATILQPDMRQYVQQRYEALKQLLGEQGASDRAANLMVGYLEEE